MKRKAAKRGLRAGGGDAPRAANGAPCQGLGLVEALREGSGISPGLLGFERTQRRRLATSLGSCGYRKEAGQNMSGGIQVRRVFQNKSWTFFCLGSCSFSSGCDRTGCGRCGSCLRPGRRNSARWRTRRGREVSLSFLRHRMKKCRSLEDTNLLLKKNPTFKIGTTFSNTGT